jgi:hypothetical protein
MVWLQGFVGKKPLGRPRRMWEDNISMDLRQVGLSGMDWTHLAKDRDQSLVCVNMVMKFWVP